MNVVVQRVVPGERSLKEHINAVFAGGLRAGVDGLSAPVRKAGRGLAELHASKAAGGPVVTWKAQLDRSPTPPTIWSQSCRSWQERCSRWWRVWRRWRSTFRPDRWWRASQLPAGPDPPRR